MHDNNKHVSAIYSWKQWMESGWKPDAIFSLWAHTQLKEHRVIPALTVA